MTHSKCLTRKPPALKCLRVPMAMPTLYEKKWPSRRASEYVQLLADENDCTPGGFDDYHFHRRGQGQRVSFEEVGGYPPPRAAHRYDILPRWPEGMSKPFSLFKGRRKLALLCFPYAEIASIDAPGIRLWRLPYSAYGFGSNAYLILHDQCDVEFV